MEMTTRQQYEAAYHELRKRRRNPFTTITGRLYDVHEECGIPFSVVLHAQISLYQRENLDDYSRTRRIGRWVRREWPTVKLLMAVRS